MIEAKEPKRTCYVCGTPVPNSTGFCPVCVLHDALAIEETAVLPPSEDSTPSTRFEHFELVLRDGRPYELGRGAMGVTYKAIDTNLGCPVALKVINGSYVGNQSMRQRFVAEARAAADLRHPNVATVYHLGKTGQDYFYAMEFVDGEPLDRILRFRGPLQVDVALEIVDQVALALSAAYRKGLVHRDIKPANLMVTFEEENRVTVKVIDFGLAKISGRSDLHPANSTRGAFYGTPNFASPEQCAGQQTDIRSDLYALGITLWSMLTRKPPFEGAPQEVLQKQQFELPPFAQLERFPAPITNLLKWLLEKDPAKRPQTPVELRNRIRALRRNLVDLGRFPRGVKRWAAVGAGLLLLSLGLTAWLLQSHQRSIEQLQAFQAKFDKLEQGVNAFLEVQNQARQEQTGQNPAHLEQRTYELLGKMLGVDPVKLKEQLPRFAEELKTAPNATAYQRANAAYVDKDYSEAERLALVAADEARHANPAKIAEEVKELELAGWAAEKRIEYADALGRFRDAETLTDRTRDPVTWARIQFAMAWVAQDQGRYHDAEIILREVLQERERVFGAAHSETLATRFRLALALYYQGNYAAAETEYRTVFNFREKLLGPDNPDTLAAQNNLANTVLLEGKYAEAETEFRNVLKLKAKVLGPEHPSTVTTRLNLANVLYYQGRYAEAEPEYRAIVNLKEKALGPDNPDVLQARINLASALDGEGKYAEAESEDRAIIGLQEKVLGPEHPDTLTGRNNLAEVLNHQGKHAEAEAEYRAVLKLREKVLSPENPDTLQTRSDLAQLFDEDGKYAEAEAEDRALIALEQKVLGPQNPQTLAIRANLPEVLGHEGKQAEAETEGREVLKLEESVLGVDNPATLHTCFNLALCLRSQNKMEAAALFARRAAEGIRRTFGPEHPDRKKYQELEKELLSTQP
jgi:tetratricopeptide (TPR) repeat protein